MERVFSSQKYRELSKKLPKSYKIVKISKNEKIFIKK